jgi:hypothetical protein
MVSGQPKQGIAFVVYETQNSDAIYAEHECLHGWTDVCDITSGVDDECLQCRGMRDFEKRVDVIQVNLPESEDLNLTWMQSREVNDCFPRAKQEVVVALVQLVPHLFDHGLTHAFVRETFIAINMVGFVFGVIILGVLGLIQTCQWV